MNKALGLFRQTPILRLPLRRVASTALPPYKPPVSALVPFKATTPAWNQLEGRSERVRHSKLAESIPDQAAAPISISRLSRSQIESLMDKKGDVTIFPDKDSPLKKAVTDISFEKDYKKNVRQVSLYFNASSDGISQYQAMSKALSDKPGVTLTHQPYHGFSKNSVNWHVFWAHYEKSGQDKLLDVISPILQLPKPNL